MSTRDPQMAVIRQQVNLIVEECARAAERGGPAAVRELKIPVSDELPPRVAVPAGVFPMKGDDHPREDRHL